jgi:hypothetical protein
MADGTDYKNEVRKAYRLFLEGHTYAEVREVIPQYIEDETLKLTMRKASPTPSPAELVKDKIRKETNVFDITPSDGSIAGDVTYLVHTIIRRSIEELESDGSMSKLERVTSVICNLMKSTQQGNSLLTSQADADVETASSLLSELELKD